MGGVRHTPPRRVLQQLSHHVCEAPPDPAAAQPSSATAAGAASAASAASAGIHSRALDAVFSSHTAAPPGATVELLNDRGFGVRVRGIPSVQTLEPTHVRWLLSLLFRHRLLAIAGQNHLKPPEFADFAKNFGDHPEWEVFYKTSGQRNPEGLVPGHPEVLCVTSLGPGSFSYAPERGPPYLEYDLAKSAAAADPSFVANFQWHTDNSYEEIPANATMLFVNKLPKEGGKTSLADMVAAYDALSSEMKKRIDGLTVRHYSGPGILGDHMAATYGDRWNTATIVSGEESATAEQRAFLGSPRHLLARPHPVTGARALYCPCATSRGIDGMGDDDAFTLLRELTDHALQPQFRLEHQHEEGDLVCWDTGATLHKANSLPAAATEDEVRILYRVTLKGVPKLVQPLA